MRTFRPGQSSLTMIVQPGRARIPPIGTTNIVPRAHARMSHQACWRFGGGRTPGGEGHHFGHHMVSKMVPQPCRIEPSGFHSPGPRRPRLVRDRLRTGFAHWEDRPKGPNHGSPKFGRCPHRAFLDKRGTGSLLQVCKRPVRDL